MRQLWHSNVTGNKTLLAVHNEKQMIKCQSFDHPQLTVGVSPETMLLIVFLWQGLHAPSTPPLVWQTLWPRLPWSRPVCWNIFQNFGSGAATGLGGGAWPHSEGAVWKVGLSYNTAGTECWNLKLKCNMCAWAENVFLLSTVLLTIIPVYKAEHVADGSLATRDWATVRSVP